MKVIVTKNYEEMSEKAFEIMREVVTKNPSAVLGLATGSTPVGLYKKMIADHKENGTSYKKIHTVNLDEYAGLDYSSDQSYVYFMRDNLFDHIDIDLKNTNIENGKAADRAAECARYNKLLASMQQDLQVLGIGSNGHIAFNDPPADFDTEKPYLVIKLDEKCRRQQLGEGWFPTLADVPERAISMSCRQILKSKAIINTVPDKRKAEAVRGALEGPLTNLCPSSILRTHSDVTTFLDRESASLLEKKYE